MSKEDLKLIFGDKYSEEELKLIQAELYTMARILINVYLNKYEKEKSSYNG